MKKVPILLALDFDGTICDIGRFPHIKGFRKGAKKYINKLYDEGYHITIWTCRTDSETCSDATDAYNYLTNNGVKFHNFNDNHDALNRAFETNCRKIATDFYVDDKSLWPFGIPSWFWIYWLIKWRSWRLKSHKRILSFCKPEHFA